MTLESLNEFSMKTMDDGRAYELVCANETDGWRVWFRVLSRNTNSCRITHNNVSLSWLFLKSVRILVISITKRCKLVADVRWIITTRWLTREASLGYPASSCPTCPTIACYGSLNQSASICGRGQVVVGLSSSFSQSLGRRFWCAWKGMLSVMAMICHRWPVPVGWWLPEVVLRLLLPGAHNDCKRIVLSLQSFHIGLSTPPSHRSIRNPFAWGLSRSFSWSYLAYI